MFSALLFSNFSEVVLGEHTTDKDPDCQQKKGPGQSGKCFPKKITRTVEKVIKHEDYKSVFGEPVNDIALIRLSEPVPLYSEDPTSSGAEPVCLPWASDLAANRIQARIVLTHFTFT